MGWGIEHEPAGALVTTLATGDCIRGCPAPAWLDHGRGLPDLPEISLGRNAGASNLRVVDPIADSGRGKFLFSMRFTMSTDLPIIS